MNFEAYLISKKIDSKAFFDAEPTLWTAWKNEFEQLHPNSFTVQKLNLINPIRRRYPLPLQEDLNKATDAPQVPVTAPSVAAKPGKPVMKPKPKFN